MAGVALKGLAVVVDFADRRLEDYTGGGIRSVDDLASVLTDMESHWAWLSRGRETYHWDLQRIQLSQAFTASAFSDWVAFRDAAILRLKEQVNPADYDLDGDGVMDAVYLVLASGSDSNDYIIGGMSMNQGANLFVDGQGSQSLQERAIGNFNHELGHCRELPDLYGTYSTVDYLSLMDSSWNLPGNDFSAYDRLHLSWLTPQIVATTTRDLALAADPTKMASLRVNASLASEYFLLEYRRRPSTGFGSSGPRFDGIAVYHVLEGSAQALDPPLLNVLPGDGALAPGSLTTTDLFFPENEAMSLPTTFTSYLNGAPVFQLENLRRRCDGGLTFDLVILDGTSTPTNLLANPSFESGSGSPASWTSTAWNSATATFTHDASQAHGGSMSALIQATEANDAEWSQEVTGLTPDAPYLLCGYLKGDAIVGGTAGGTVSLSGTYTWRSAGMGTFDWTQTCLLVQAPGSGIVKPACRLGTYGMTASGSLWCDDFSLIQLDKAF